MKIEESTSVETNDYKVIIFPASRAFTAKEVKEITEKLYDFLSTWAAHGKPLSSSFKIEHKQFIIITVDEEKEVAAIFRMTLKEPDSEVLMSPREGKHYIKNSSRSMLLILGPSTLKVINHAYGYTVTLTSKTHESLQDVFFAEVEKRRQLMETEFSANVKHSLRAIIDSLKKEE